MAYFRRWPAARRALEFRRVWPAEEALFRRPSDIRESQRCKRIYCRQLILLPTPCLPWLKNWAQVSVSEIENWDIFSKRFLFLFSDDEEQQENVYGTNIENSGNGSNNLHAGTAPFLFLIF